MSSACRSLAILIVQVMPTESKTRPEGNAYRAYILLALSMVYTFNFIDRQIIGILAVPIQQELGLSDTQLSLMGGFAFALFYSTLGIPIAWVADRYNRTWIITITLALWSGATALCGFANNFTQLFLSRVLVGVGEAGGVAPSYSIISDYFPPNQRARALAVYSFGIPFGSALGIVCGGMLATWLDWRAAFVIVGLAGLIFAPIFRLSVREPKRGQYDAQTGTQEKPPSIFHVFKTLKRKPTFWYLSFGAAAASMMGYGLFFWLPTFLVRTYQDKLGDFMDWTPAFLVPAEPSPLLWAAYFYGLIVLIGGIIGLSVGSMVVDHYGRRNPRIYAAAPAFAFFCVAPFFGLAMLTNNLSLTFFVLLVATMLGMAWMGPVLSALQQIVAPNMRATTAAMFLLITNLIGLGFGNLLIGGLSDLIRPIYADQSLQYALLVSSSLYFVAGGLLYMGSRKITADWHQR